MDENLALFKEGRFHMMGLSLCIPDGYYLDMDPIESLGDVSFELVSPGKTHRISICVSHDNLPPGEQLVYIITEMDGKMLSKPEPIALGGLHGRIATYKSLRHVYAEAIFSLEDHEEYNALHLVFVFPQGYDITDFTKSDDYLRVANQIRKEEAGY